MEEAVRAFKNAVACVPNRRSYAEVGRVAQLKMLRQVEDLARCVLGQESVTLRKLTGGGWALRFNQGFAHLNRHLDMTFCSIN